MRKRKVQASPFSDYNRKWNLFITNTSSDIFQRLEDTGAKDTQRVVITSDRLQITDHSPAEGEGLSKEVVDGVKKFVFFMDGLDRDTVLLPAC